MNITIPFSEACERNKDVILETIKPHLVHANTVLEIGSGTAQHAIHFSQALNNLQWQTSDQAFYLEGIQAALANAKSISRNYGSERTGSVLSPLELDVNQPLWVESGQRYDAIYTANTFHIMAESDVQQFFSGIHEVTKENSTLIVYGPFKYGGEFTSESNASFDSSLRSRGVGSAIRDFEFVHGLASAQNFELISDYHMPANNQCLVWQRKT